jgi:hypothetical protein
MFFLPGDLGLSKSSGWNMAASQPANSDKEIIAGPFFTPVFFFHKKHLFE